MISVWNYMYFVQFSQRVYHPEVLLSLERDGLRQAELCPRNTMMTICGAPTTFQGYGIE